MKMQYMKMTDQVRVTAGHETDGTSKLHEVKMQKIKMQDTKVHD